MSPSAPPLIQSADTAVLRQVRRALGGTPAVPVARAMSHFGEHALGWLAVGAVGWTTGRRRDVWGDAVVGVVAAHAAGVLVKRVIRRPRPAFLDVPALVGTPSALSFPSAHSCSTAAAAVGFAPVLGAPVMTGVTGAMLLSRVLLGVHYPSDVIGGALLGSGVAALVGRTARRRRGGRS
jgi:membrane-associated phospholipid phosphatase